MLYLNILLTVKEKENVSQVRDLLTEAGRLSRQEPGCFRFEVYQSQNDETKFMLSEHWQDQAAIDVHRTAQAYSTIYKPRVLPLVIREGHPCNRLD
jgi:quinol monooxygenase YgiN